MSFLTRSSLKNRLILSLATLAIVALGLISMNSLKQELMPSLQAPMAFISAQSQGLAPEEMASTITEPLEQAVRAVPGVTSVTSTTATGDAQVLVEWTFGEDDEETLRTIRSAAESLKPGFPSGTEVNVASGARETCPRWC